MNAGSYAQIRQAYIASPFKNYNVDTCAYRYITYGYRIRIQEHEAETTEQQRHQVTRGSFFLFTPTTNDAVGENF